MADNSKVRTHTAYAYRREGKKFGRMLECGTGRIERIDNERYRVHVFADRLPIGGFTGYFLLSPIGTPPPEPQPQRPGQADEDEDEA
jgi:hypothetical protein